MRIIKLGLPVWLVLLLMLPGCVGWQGAKFILAGDQVELQDVPGTAATDADAPDILFLAMDGVNRDLLYDMLRSGELPELATLLGGAKGHFDHAFFSDRLQSTLPSSTGVAWATAMTGVQPAMHGVTGNEFFIRDTGQFAAPVPVTVNRIDPVLRIYTEGYANKLLHAPTVYEQMRKREPGIRITVGMHQYYAGADELIVTDRTVLVDGARTYASSKTVDRLTNQQSLTIFSDIDDEVLGNVTDAIDDGATPDVLTVYLPGIDHFAHVSPLGPDKARRMYLKQATEPRIRALRKALQKHGLLRNRYVVITSDHGHTAVPKDDRHSLAPDGKGEPRALLESAGYTPRPLHVKVDDETYFDTVLAYQGALAFVYVANQSTCPIKGQLCDWSKPARAEDIRKIAQLFYSNNRDGDRVPQMKGALDMILVRTGASRDAKGSVFEVYEGDGRSEPIDSYLAAHPHPHYVELQKRLNDLTVGPYGDRAGDVILIAHNGDRDNKANRFYFAALYHSWHGSPSKNDADVPLIVAHPDKSRAQLRSVTDEALKDGHSLAAVTRLMMKLRYGDKSPQP